MTPQSFQARRPKARSATLHRLASSGSRFERPAPSERSNRVFLLLLYAAFAVSALFFLGFVYALLTGDLPPLAP